MLDQLNGEQLQILNTILESMEEGRNNFFFIEGHPGHGKMFLVKTLSLILRAREQIVLIIGSSALAATAYERGRTMHHMFSIPVTDESVDLHSSIHPHSPRADLIRNASAIVWDKLPAINRAAWESVNELCRIICNWPQIPFGGKSFIGSGDFRQAGPVVSGAGETATLAASVKSSMLWPHIWILNLDTPIRSMGDPRFTTFIDCIGEDCSGSRHNLVLIAATTNIDNSVEFLFPQHVLEDPETCLQRVFLSPLNIYVDEFNDRILERLPEARDKQGQESTQKLHKNTALRADIAIRAKVKAEEVEAKAEGAETLLWLWKRVRRWFEGIGAAEHVAQRGARPIGPPIYVVISPDAPIDNGTMFSPLRSMLRQTEFVLIAITDDRECVAQEQENC
ncbi:PIF1-like helicase-domain-containing protein [Suillus tomentosus]|nr:PIF1-like helicase-domain-containing protein [Suillus tomentosus]